MADRKITDLTALAAGSQATGDLVTIVDVSEAAAADKNKKMTVENLFKGIPGDVGIGVSAPDGTLHVHSGTAGSVTANGNADNLIVEHSGTGGISILTPDANHGYVMFGSPTSNEGAILRYRDSDNIFAIGTEDSDGALAFRSGAGSEAVRIDSSGNVGIGNTSPGTFTEVGASNLVVGSGSGGEGITIYSGTSSTGILAFADGTSGSAQYQGMVNYSHSANAMRFSTAGSERLRIDSSGRLLLGLTSGRAVGGGTQAIAQIETTSQNGLSWTEHLAQMTCQVALYLIPQRMVQAARRSGCVSPARETCALEVQLERTMTVAEYQEPESNLRCLCLYEQQTKDHFGL